MTLLKHWCTQSYKDMWGQDLTAIAGLESAVVADLKMIRADGAKAAFEAAQKA